MRRVGHVPEGAIVMVWIHVYATRWNNVRSEVHETQDDADRAYRLRENLKLPQKVVEVIL